jgi:hypothetical protein
MPDIDTVRTWEGRTMVDRQEVRRPAVARWGGHLGADAR